MIVAFLAWIVRTIGEACEKRAFDSCLSLISSSAQFVFKNPPRFQKGPTIVHLPEMIGGYSLAEVEERGGHFVNRRTLNCFYCRKSAQEMELGSPCIERPFQKSFTGL